MYCSQCGKQISDDSAFCRYCGAKLNTNEERKIENHYEESDNEVIYSYTPEFHGGYVIKKLIPLFLFFSVFFSILVSFISVFLYATGILKQRSMLNEPGYGFPGTSGLISEIPSSTPFDHFFKLGNFIIGISIAFLLIIVLGYGMIKKRYEHSVYQFYKDRMEYIDGYFNYNKKQIFYKNIQELSMSQNVFQRKYNIGSIKMTTSGVTYSNNHTYANGITIYDLGDVDRIYSNLKDLIK